MNFLSSNNDYEQEKCKETPVKLVDFQKEGMEEEYETDSDEDQADEFIDL
jgi:hypothetical protein